MNGWLWLICYLGLGASVAWLAYRLERRTPRIRRHDHGPRATTLDDHWATNAIIVSGAYDPVVEAEALTREAAS